MRNLLVVALFLVGTSVVIAQDDRQDEARAVVCRAIKTTGLEGKAIPNGMRVKTKFSVDAFDKDANLHEVKVRQTLTISFPYRFKEVNEMSVLNEKITFTTIYDGKESWITGDGNVREVEPVGLKDYRELGNVVEATYFLTPLLDKKKYKIEAVGMALADGRRASEIRVSREGFEDMRLYFDYKTNLLVKMEREGLNPLVAMPCTETRIYRSYRKINGRMFPGTVLLLRNGELVFEMETMDFIELNAVDPKEFDPPKN